MSTGDVWLLSQYMGNGERPVGVFPSAEAAKAWLSAKAPMEFRDTGDRFTARGPAFSYLAVRLPFHADVEGVSDVVSG